MFEAGASPSRKELARELFGTQTLYLPIRHHSPACAWHLRQAIRDHDPDVICIEAPEDLIQHAPHLTEEDAKYPLAIIALGERREDAARAVRYFPLSDHAPETIAIRAAATSGADLRFIDLTSNARIDPSSDTTSFVDESPFSSSAFVEETCRKLGLNDGAELWDHLFETRLGRGNWQDFFCDVHAYCCALRETTPDAEIAADDTLARESNMRAHLKELAGKRVVVVTGGFHTPALLDPAAPAERVKAKAVESYLVGYGEEALDALNGYGAGLRYPAWHAHAWQAAQAANAPPDWPALAQTTIASFAQDQASAGHPITFTQHVEMLTIAQGMARFKSRDAILLHDLFDGLRSAVVKGQVGPRNRWVEAFDAHLCGFGLGRAPAIAGQPPLVRDAQDRAGRCRFDLGDTLTKHRKLDIHRKPPQALASQYCHQMRILDAGFATLVSGPDFVTGTRQELLFEEWDYAWSPFVEGRLIEKASLGATLPEAAATHLLVMAEDAATGDLATLSKYLLSGLRAGLRDAIATLVTQIKAEIRHSGDLLALARMIRRICAALSPGVFISGVGDLDLSSLVQKAYQRFIYLCGNISQQPEDALDDAIEALCEIAALLRSDQGGDLRADQFDTVITAIQADRDTPALLNGAVSGLAARAGLLPLDAVAQGLRGGLAGVTARTEEKCAYLDGLLRTAPMLLWQSTTVLAVVNDFLSQLDDDGFLGLLPALRRNLTQLNPHETQRLADEVAGLLGVSGAQMLHISQHDEATVMRGAQIDAAILHLLDNDGLRNWGQHEQ